ncbi:hypothetical protein [Helicobacter sp. 23-1045]
MSSDTSCIVNIKAGQPIALVGEKKVGMASWVIAGVLMSPLLLIINAIEHNSLDYMAVFTPKNQHIYCINFTMNDNFRQFRDGRTCLAEYRAIYKSKHRDEQKEWFDDLVDSGDKRAYKE